MSKRPTTAARGYDGQWYRARTLFLRQHPVCAFCGGKATQVDHIKTVRERPDLRMNPANWRPLCASDHARRTAMDQGAGKRVYGADAAGNPTRPGHPWSAKP